MQGGRITGTGVFLGKYRVAHFSREHSVEGIIIGSYRYKQKVHDAQVQIACVPDQWYSQGRKIGRAKRSQTPKGPGLSPQDNFCWPHP